MNRPADSSPSAEFPEAGLTRSESPYLATSPSVPCPHALSGQSSINEPCPICLLSVGLELQSSEQGNARLAKPNFGNNAFLPPSPGANIAGYQIIQKIAEGGMGEVFLAYQERLDRFVALKFLTTRREFTEDFEERFIREAKALAGLKHPSIVSIYEVGEHGGKPFFSMEFIEGQDLSEVLNKKALSQEKAVDYLLQLTKAVQFAHDRWILHRDIKPSNVLIDLDGQAHLSDFGLATKMEVLTDLTMAGNIIGSPNYLSPEQAAGKMHEVSAASDIFALGVLFYECLTNHLPFQGANLQDTLRKIQEETPRSPAVHRPEIHPDLVLICFRCLEKEPRQRYSNAAELAADLTAWIDHQPIAVTTRSARQGSLLPDWLSNPKWLWIALGISWLLILLLGWAYWNLSSNLTP